MAERSAFMYRHIMQVKDLAPGETPEDHMQEVIEKYKEIDQGVGKKSQMQMLPDQTDPQVTSDDGGPRALADLTKAQLIAHAAGLTPPLTLDKQNRKDDLVAGIQLHIEANA